MREAHRISWDNFISQIEQDVHGRQNFAYKVLKNFNRSEKDDARIDVIENTEWINHYKKLRYQENTVQTIWDNTNLYNYSPNYYRRITRSLETVKE